MADEQVEIEIVLDDGLVQKGFAKVQKQAKKTGDKVDRDLGGSFKKIAALAAGVAAAIGAVRLGKEALAASQAQENAINALNVALSLTGKFSVEAAKDLQGFAAELQRTTEFGDEAVLETAALIQGLGNLETDALKGATAAAADLSAALGIDLKAAALLVGKAAAGEVSSFSRYGLIIKKGANEAETFANALDGINSKFGGAAAGQVQTFSGRIEQLSNNFGDALEGIGDFITKTPILTKLIGKLSGFFGNTADNLKKFTSNAAGIANVNNALVDFGKNFVKFVIAPIEFVINLVKIAANIINAALASIATALVFVGNEILQSLAAPIKLVIDILAAAADKIPGVSDSIRNGLKDASQSVANFGKTSERVFQGTADFAKAQFDGVAESSSKIFDFENAAKSDTFVEGFRTTAKEVQATIDATNERLASGGQVATEAAVVYSDTLGIIYDTFSGAVGGIFDIFTEKLFQNVKITEDQLKQLNKAFNQSLAGGIVKSTQTFVTALKNGENAFKALGASILGLLGDLAIQVGTFLISTGVAQLSLLSAPGGPVIAAGLGLVALGTVLKSLGGSGFAAGSAAGAGGGGSAAVGGSESDFATSDVGESDVEEKTTKVAIRVDANDVIDPIAVGQAISNVLNESFQATGTSLITETA